VPSDALPTAAAAAVRPRPLALLVPLLLMAAGALETPEPWSTLWIAVPVLGALGYLGGLYGLWIGWMSPLLALGWALALPDRVSVWGWVLVGATVSAQLGGMSRRQGISPGGRLWSLLPLLGLTVAFPFSSLYEPAVRAASAGVEKFGEEAYKSYAALGLEGGTLSELAAQVQQATKVFSWVVGHLLPFLLFGWAACLVALAILLAGRAARAVGRPLAPGAGFVSFRLPEGAVWLLLLGLASIAARQPQLLPAGVNLVACLGLGYCLQGMAVIDFTMLARGFAPGMISVLFVFVMFFALPVLAVTSTGLGVADIWLDVRRRVRESGGKEGEA
jgi:hypothetical protein